jgi:hypothetical protein
MMKTMDSVVRHVQWAIQRYEVAQVDLNGQYSVARFSEFMAYSHTISWQRVLLVLVVSPLPSITMLILMDIVHLEPLTAKPFDSPIFWTRGYIVSATMTIGILTQLRHDIPWLQLSRQFTLAVTWLASTVGVAVTMLWSFVIGHPLPFSMLLGAPPWLAIQVVCVYWRARDVLREQPRLQQYLVSYGAFWMTGLSLTAVYPMYVYAFTSIRNGTAQSAFVLVLPLIKVVIKFTMGRCLRDLDDLKPVALIFTADIFHALFVSYAMQNATSLGTVLVLIAIDLLHMGLTYRDVNRIVKELDIHRDAIIAAAQEDARKFAVVETNVLSVAEKILGRNAMVRSDRAIRLATWVHVSPTESSSQRGCSFVGIGSSVSSAGVVKPDFRGSPMLGDCQVPALKKPSHTNEGGKSPQMSPTSTASAWITATHIESHSTDAVTLVRKTLQLLYVSEFIVLIEYVEIVVPLIFSKSFALQRSPTSLSTLTLSHLRRRLHARDVLPAQSRILSVAQVDERRQAAAVGFERLDLRAARDRFFCRLEHDAVA